MAKLTIFIFATLAAFSLASANVVLQIAGGKIRGKVVQSETNVTVNEYLGIRFARANRYEKPKPVESWARLGVYDATAYKSVCHQFGILASFMPQDKTQSEDCLFLNVFQPASVKANRSVMLFIHGGAFEMGSSIMDGKDLAALGDVILVTIQYRLGMLGWMTGDDIPANLGLYDQIAALQFVKKNVHFFGGNPDDITIFGESAGSISVGSLVLSPLAKGLFKRAILQSGSPAVDVLGNSMARAEEKTKILAHKLDCPNGTIAEAVKCIRKASIEQLKKVSGDDFVRNDFFVPTYGDEVMPIRPADALKTGKFNHVDLMYGVTRDEGSIFALIMVPEMMSSDKLNLTQVKKDMMTILSKYNISHKEEIVEFYTAKLGVNSTQDDYKIAISSVFGDYSLICPTILFGEEMARQAPNNHYYSYRMMEYRASFTPKWLGVTHGADLQYLFSLATTKTDPELYQLSKNIIHAWSSFAKSGVVGKMSNVQWEEALNRATKDYSTKYMSLEANKYKMVDGFYKATCETFWKPKMFA